MAFVHIRCLCFILLCTITGYSLEIKGKLINLINFNEVVLKDMNRVFSIYHKSVKLVDNISSIARM